MDQPTSPTPQTDGLISHAASEATKVGALTSGLGWVTSNTVIAILGLAVAILGFLVNLYFQNKRDKREAQLHDAKMALFLKTTTAPELPAKTAESIEKATGSD